jgi:hypothetical protein
MYHLLQTLLNIGRKLEAEGSAHAKHVIAHAEEAIRQHLTQGGSTDAPPEVVAALVPQGPPLVMRAKFFVASVENASDSAQHVGFAAVSKTSGYDGAGLDEDNTFAKFTPQAQADFWIMNPALRDVFRQGDKYYADFTLAERFVPQTVNGLTQAQRDKETAAEAEAAAAQAAAGNAPA